MLFLEHLHAYTSAFLPVEKAELHLFHYLVFFFLPLAAVVYCNINGKIVPGTGLRAEMPVDRANHISTASTDLKLKFRLAWLIYYKVKEMFVQK